MQQGKNLSFAAFAWVGVAAALALTATALFTIHQLDASAGNLLLASQAIRNHLETDMMHDAVRSDVLSALLAEDAAQLDGARKDLEEHLGIFRAALDRNQKLPLNPTLRKPIGEVEDDLNSYAAKAEQILTLAGRDRAAARASYAGFEEAFEKLEGRNAAVTTVISQWATEVERGQATTAQRGFWTVALSGLAVLAIVSSIPLVLRRALGSRVGQIGRQLAQTAARIAGAAGKLSQSSHDLARGTAGQVQAMEHTARTSREVVDLTRQAAQSCRESTQLVTTLTQRAANSSGLMTDLDSAMRSISASSQRITGILREMDDLAFQTNLLALNASVEAARAGSAGAGFAVVADEVRRLAQRSTQASQESSQLIEGAQLQSQTGNQCASRLAEFVQGLLGEFERINHLIHAVNSASQEQVQRMESIAAAVLQSQQVTAGNSRNSQQTAGIAAELDQHSGELQEAVARLHSVVGTER